MVSIENLETLKYQTFSKKILGLSIIYGKCENENEKIRKKKNINWDIKNFWFNWEYKITLKICLKKT